MLAHLIDWVAVASTAAPDINGQPAPPKTMIATGLMSPRLDTSLAAHITAKLHADLPALSPHYVDNSGQAAQILAGVRLDRQLEVQEQRAQRAEDRAPKLISQSDPELCEKLMRLVGAADESLLPPVYRRLLNALKAQRRNILELLLQARASEHGSATKQAPVVTSELVAMFMSASFGAQDIDDLSQGLTPYAANHRAYGTATEVQSRGSDYDSMLSGVVSPTLAERQLLKQGAVKQPGYVPMIDSGLAEHSLLVDVALGPHHPVASFLREDIYQGAWEACRPGLQNYAFEHFRNSEVPFGAGIFRSIQLKMVIYFNALAQPHHAPVPLPDLRSVFQLVMEQNFVLLPAIPARYLAPQPPPAAPRAPRTPLPPVPGSPAPRTPGAPTDRTGTMVTNDRALPAHRAKFDAAGKTIAQLKEDPRAPLKNQGGGKICLSYHIKGVCFSNCGTLGRDGTLKGHTLEGTEVQRFDDFVTAACVRE